MATSSGSFGSRASRRPSSYDRSLLTACLIAINAGRTAPSFGKILEKDQYSYGFDSQIGEYVNLISKGGIDQSFRLS